MTFDPSLKPAESKRQEAANVVPIRAGKRPAKGEGCPQSWDDAHERCLAELSGKLQVASMNYNDIFVRYTRALDQRAQARSEKEVRSMTHAARVSAEASKTSARATVASVIVAIVALVVALLSHGK